MAQRIEIAARIRDLNAVGHVDSVEAIRIVDEARYRLVGRGGDIGYLAGYAGKVGEVVVAQRTEIRHEMFLEAGGFFTVTAWVSRVGGSSFTMSFELRQPGKGDSEPPDLIAEMVMATLDLDTRSGWSLDAAVRARLENDAGRPLNFR